MPRLICNREHFPGQSKEIYMLSKIKERPLHFLFLSFIVGLVLGLNLTFMASAQEAAHKYLDYFHQVYQTLRTEYVEERDSKSLFYGAIQGMIASMDDPFSRFLDEKSYDELKEMTTGQFVGIGVEITIQDDEIVVISPIDDSPAMRAGVKAGDVIVQVDDMVVKGKKLAEIVNLIKGKPKSKVSLHVKREGFDGLLNFDMDRAPIKIKSVDYSMIAGNGIGYIKVKNFGSETANDVAAALKSMKKEGAKKFIVDLRYNPGGLLNAAVEMSGLFLEKGKVIVSTRGRQGKGNDRVYSVENNPLSISDELVVLVNKGSASASEIFAGAIRDNRRGRLLGEKTFGKGSVQKTFQLDENVGVAITIAKYYTPSGEMIHRKGIMPDIVVEQDRMSKEDRDAMKVINRDKLVEKYGHNVKDYSEQTRQAFREYLNKTNAAVSDRLSDMLLKDNMYRHQKRPVYDLEFDDQLVSAIDLLKKGK
jgi:carboxyl-terminal processing protease